MKNAPQKALITGIAGFVGSHLAELLLSKNFQVHGYYHPDHSIENISHIKDRINLTPADLSSSKNIFESLEKIKPDYIFHLAAHPSPAQSFKDPRETLENNIFGQLNILEALVKLKSKAKILIVGTAEEYGNVEAQFNPINEDCPLAPTSPYAVSKVAQDFLGYQYFLHHNLNIVRTRSFNHIGPRQSDKFVVPSFAKQIAQIEKQSKGTIEVGNLESYRDFTDVRDIAKAYLLALQKGKMGEVYNIGSGKPVKISHILDVLISFSSAKIQIKIDKSRFHPVDIKTLCCDYSKFHKDTSWRPEIPLNQTLFDTIEYERQKLKKVN